jgi:hypothetical protein
MREGGGGGAAPAPLQPQPQPCTSPLVTLSDAKSSLWVHTGEEGGEGCGGGALAGGGAATPGWASHWSPRAYDVKAEVVAARPLRGNFSGWAAPSGGGGAGATAGWAGRVVLFERGPPLSLADKVRAAARAGALGAVIVDDGAARCGTAAEPTFTQRCVQGSERARGQGFASEDEEAAWRGARIPALLVTREHGLRLLGMVQG